MKSLLAESDSLMNVAECQTVDQIDRSWLESFPKDYQLMPQKAKL